MFAEFGEVDLVDLHREPETGLSKGFAFVQFRDPEAAKRALVQVNGRDLAGRTIKVGLVNAATGKPGTTTTNPLGEMDEEGVGNLSMDAQSRAQLMAKLQRSDEKVPGASTCLLLKHMFTEEEAAEPNFEQELTEDVKEACSKHGQVKHIYIDRNNPVRHSLPLSLSLPLPLALPLPLFCLHVLIFVLEWSRVCTVCGSFTGYSSLQ